MIDANWLWIIVPVVAMLGMLVRGLCENGKTEEGVGDEQTNR